MRQKLGVLLLAAATGWFIPAHALGAQPKELMIEPPAAGIGLNNIQSFDVADDGGTLYVRLKLQEPLKATPASFTVANPPRIAFDFPATGNALGTNLQSIERGDLRSANIVQVGDRTRLVLNLARLLHYTAQASGNTLTIALAPANGAASPTPTSVTPHIATAAAPAAKPHTGSPSLAAPVQAATVSAGQTVNDINFRRGAAGEGRVVVQLSEANTGVDVRQQGGKLIVTFLKTALPDNLRRRSDVTDFGTPVSSLLAEQQGENVRLTVTPSGLWEHNAYQSNDQFVLEVKRVVEDPNKLVQRGNGRVKYAGDKLSLNFQNVDVRSVLQVVADFTDFNIVTSDSVQGNLTLRLKDVPWDQALDIILQAKGLDMRKSGNVIWIAPGEELAAREKMINEARAQVEELEPLQTESFQVNYHKAGEISKFLQAKGQTVLSKRGSVVGDERSNKVFVTDVGSRLGDVRRVISEIDIAPKQVLIEARIVEAGKTFSRDLGVRLGYGDTKLKNLGNGAQVGFGHSSFAKYEPGRLPDPNDPQDLGVPPTLTEAGPGDSYNRWDIFPGTPGNGASGAPASSGAGYGLENPFLQLGLTLVNKDMTRFLNIELQAQETDGKLRIVSSPRVLTANNVEALIEQGKEIPYQEASSSGSTSVSFKKAVLSLKVKPQITPDGRLQLTIQVNKDNALMEESVRGVPPIETKSVKSDVLIENGGTVVIGGIYLEEEHNSVSKVPLLGDIPFVGALFRTTNRSTDQRELLVFITPRIVEDSLSLR
ncbi:MAG: type IV pilus secretin PilQ [Azoarcus sp.]|jgi:type IV pilus assembly protein PilQ|nr:type IV pilus secretin PilQ [Azoarcus sp.]